MKLRLARKSVRAMTLVDVVMGVAVLGIMAGAVLGSLRFGFFTLQMVRENQRATQIILEKLETIRLYSWDQVTAPTNFIPRTFNDVYDPTAPADSQGVTYAGTVSVDDFPISTTYSTNMRQLTVTLNWTTRTILRSRTFTTYISKDGLQNYVY